jgi:hypothetical protein
MRFTETAPVMNHQLSISGGTESMKYLVSGDISIMRVF